MASTGPAPAPDACSIPDTSAAPTPLSQDQSSPSAILPLDFSSQALSLIGAENIDAWIQQTEAMARATHCLAELTAAPEEARPAETAGPAGPAQTIGDFVSELHSRTASTILCRTVSGPVWAYMRVLGYGPAGTATPTPGTIYHFAKLAAGRMGIPGTPQQPAVEREAMIRELFMPPSGYPSMEHYMSGIEWLKGILEKYIREGDERLAMMYYSIHQSQIELVWMSPLLGTSHVDRCAVPWPDEGGGSRCNTEPIVPEYHEQPDRQHG